MGKSTFLLDFPIQLQIYGETLFDRAAANIRPELFTSILFSPGQNTKAVSCPMNVDMLSSSECAEEDELFIARSFADLISLLSCIQTEILNCFLSKTPI